MKRLTQLNSIFPASKRGLELKSGFGDQRQHSLNASDCMQGLSQEMWKLRVRNVPIKGLSGSGQQPPLVSVWEEKYPGQIFPPCIFPVHKGILSQGNH